MNKEEKLINFMGEWYAYVISSLMSCQYNLVFIGYEYNFQGCFYLLLMLVNTLIKANIIDCSAWLIIDQFLIMIVYDWKIHVCIQMKIMHE